MSDLIDSLSRNLRGYWCPMIQYGGLTLRDQTRFKNHGTLTNFDATIGNDWIMSRVRGRSGRVLDFDGVNDYVTASSSSLPLGNPSFTFAHWFLLRSTATSGGVFGWGLSSGSLSCVKSYVNVRGAGVVSVEFAGNNPAIGPTIATNRWYHLCFVKRPGAINTTSEIWIDGTRQTLGGTSSTGTPNLQSGSLTIGVFDIASADYSPIQFADGNIWNRALTPGEIQELYRIGPGWHQPQLPRQITYSEQQAGFRAYWAKRQSQLIGGGV